jgi:hypothetical protein
MSAGSKLRDKTPLETRQQFSPRSPFYKNIHVLYIPLMVSITRPFFGYGRGRYPGDGASLNLFTKQFLAGGLDWWSGKGGRQKWGYLSPASVYAYTSIYRIHLLKKKKKTYIVTSQLSRSLLHFGSAAGRKIITRARSLLVIFRWIRSLLKWRASAFLSEWRIDETRGA